MAELISQERFEIWDQFIERWPIEKLWAICGCPRKLDNLTWCKMPVK